MARSSPILAHAHPRLRTQRRPVLPSAMEPMLALAGELPHDPEKYGFEYKWDGVRALTFWDGKKLAIHSRNGLDITRRYPELLDLGAALGKHGTILDGEIVALDENGRPSFPRLQHRMHAEGPDKIARLAKEIPAWYVLFDVLWSDGRSTMDLPYLRRRAILEELTIAGPSWQITPAHVGEGKAMLESAQRNKLEGLVAKRLDSVYEPGRRSPAWLKIKVVFGQEFVIGGWVPEGGVETNRVGALLLGYYDCPAKGKPPQLHYAGSVGSGYNAASHSSLTRALKAKATDNNPFSDAVPKKAAVFVKPQLVAEVEFRRWPAGGLIHQASFKGLRTDKEARQVVKEGQGGLPSRE